MILRIEAKKFFNVYCLQCGAKMTRKRKTTTVGETLFFNFECKPCKRQERLFAGRLNK